MSSILRPTSVGGAIVALVAVGAFVAANTSGPGRPVAAQAEGRAGALTVRLPGAAGELVFSSYFGGLEWDEGLASATTPSGHTIVGGFTLSRDFPIVGASARRRGAIVDGFVVKLAPDTRRVVWSTKLAGIDHDLVNAVATDAAGNVYVAGRTGSPDFPTKGGVRDNLRGRSCTGAPCHDAFVAKLNADGRLVWSTLFGGSRNEEALGIAVGDDRSVYVTGLTDSHDLPTRSALQRRFGSVPCEGDLPCAYDAFVTKFSPGGDRVVYSTYLGGQSTDVARAVAVDDAGAAYVTGSTSSTDFPLARSLQSSFGGKRCGPPPGEVCRQAFVTKLSPAGSSAAYSTLLGGADQEDGFGVAVDTAGAAHVTGATASTDFPTRNPVQQRLDNASCTEVQPEELCDDGFVTKMAANGQKLVYSTYLGGRAEDQGLDVDVTGSGDTLVGGRTDSDDFPTRDATQAFGGYTDGFAARLTGRGTLVWSTFLGGSEADRVMGIAADANGSAHATGRTLSPDLPTRRPVQDQLRDEDYDVLVAVIK